ncbi:MAG: tol-pal system protein YbgF [Deltaproteobacteria bacterium]|nr:tol-pal system protein YbgF [Deltaproteobacteria bacterium]MBI3388616.1 tol-pal system protein YbgF [Deltaproteobacteria bacterium]
MRPFRYPFLLCVLAAVASGCATRADLVKVQKDQREVRALLADTQVAVDSLRRKVEQIRSQIDEANRAGGHGARGGSRSTEDLEKRLAELEARLAAQGQTIPPVGVPPGGSPPAGVMPGTPTTGEAPPVVASPPPTPEPTKPLTVSEAALAREDAALQGTKVDEEYRDGIRAVKAGQCDQAEPKFRAFIRKNPKSDLADNAQYWVGECYYRQKNYNKAIVELNDVLSKYPKGDKVPSALWTLAAAFEDSGDKLDARLVLQKLISDHPKSEEAEQGRQKLRSLGD